MKDYYQILDILDNASQEAIKSAFRKLAFQYHPDVSPGDKKQAEEKFKEINEAYAVLGDESKRREYDLTRREQLAQVGYNIFYDGFPYSQREVFRETFSNQARFDEISRMFNQSGLRFDQAFINEVFFEPLAQQTPDEPKT